MAVDDTLRRVEADRARGDLHMARQRLRGLVGSFPTRLDLRERLAEACRATGDPVEAGRWSYLSEHRDAKEQKAFESAYARDPLLLMAALSWRGTEDDAATDEARQRLTDLRARAERKKGGPVPWERPRYDADGEQTRRQKVVVSLVVAWIIMLVALGVIGAAGAVFNGIRIVHGWLQ